MTMKKTGIKQKAVIIAIALCLTTSLSYAQYFRLGGNSASPPADNILIPGNNFLGSQAGFNVPMNFVTNGVQRMKLNEDVSYQINRLPAINRNGYLLLGQNNNGQASGPALYNRGAFSLLHLNGDDASSYQEVGYRNWMRTGITMTGNNDLSYFGLRQVGNNTDHTETTIAWADNQNDSWGPDDLVFRFLSDSATILSNNLSVSNDLDGLHIARFTPTGQIGFGNTFGITNAGEPNIGYVRPQNLLHMSLDEHKAVFLQIGNEIGTGQGAGDGLKFGYPTTTANNKEAQLNQQENDRLSLYSNSGERIRVTQIGALNNGVAFNPGSLATNLTRIGISHNPATPVTRPIELTALGLQH
jgi:hypothetical protein